MTIREQILAILKTDPALHFSQHIGLAKALEEMVAGALAESISKRAILKVKLEKTEAALAEAQAAGERQYEENVSLIVKLAEAQTRWEHFSALTSGHRNELETELASLRARIVRLELFLHDLADNDSEPTDPVADNGMTVWDAVRGEARALVLGDVTLPRSS